MTRETKDAEDAAVSVVVGIDGSRAAIHAAHWGATEAVSRDIPLRLVHVIQSTSTDVRREIEEGQAVLRIALGALTEAAEQAAGAHPRVDTSLLRGPIAATLVAASHDAAMICLGAAGSMGAEQLGDGGPDAGSHAAAVAQSARCPVAIIRGHDTPPPAGRPLAVVLDESTDDDSLLHVAIAEARLRRTSLQALSLRRSGPGQDTDDPVERRLAAWRRSYPDVIIETVVLRGKVSEYLAACHPPVQLVIIGSAEPDEVTGLIGPFGRHVLIDTECSVLVVARCAPIEEPSTRASIVTLTMNPAVDVTTGIDAVLSTDKMRCDAGRYDPGGGGINVARIASVLGAPVSAVFPAGGVTGHLLTELVFRAGVPAHVVDIAEATRESFTVNERGSGLQYRFVLPGPRLTAAEQVQCLDTLRAVAASADFVVASGSLPDGINTNFYQQVADMCADNGARLILDTSGTGLRHVTSGVFLLKASVRELREYVGRALTTEADQLAAAREVVDRGCAQIVVVSLGSAGALLATANLSQRYSPVPVPRGSGVGAGDSMVAAITVGLIRGWSLQKSVQYGVAAGAAMLLTPGTAPCTVADVERLFALVAQPEELGLVAR